MNDDLQDQLDLAKTAMNRAMGHLGRIEQLLKRLLKEEDQE